MANRIGNVDDNIASLTNYSYSSDMLRNLIINPKIDINQRGITSTSTNGIFICDRWRLISAGSGLTTTTLTTNTTDITTPLEGGIKNSIRMYLSGSDWAGVGYWRTLEQPIEMINFKKSMFGTATPKKISLSFWVRASKTGIYTYNLLLPSMTNPYVWVGEYKINTVNTWERKTFTISISSSQSVAWGGTNDTNTGLFLRFVYGSDNVLPATTSDWYLTNNIYITPSTTILTVGDYINHTGIQLEVNDFATSLQWRPTFVELKLCKRYYIKLDTVNIGKTINAGDCYSGKIDLEDEVRTAPSLDALYTSSYTVNSGLAGVVALRAIAGAEPSNYSIIFWNSSNNWTVGTDVAVLAYLTMELP